MEGVGEDAAAIRISVGTGLQGKRQRLCQPLQTTGSPPVYPHVVERLLREIEASLAMMTAAQREATARALQALVAAAKGLKDVQLSKSATMHAVNVLVIGAAQGQGMAHHLAEARRLAPKVGKHVAHLVSALS